jgi:sugar lactone lactonase YvrE
MSFSSVTRSLLISSRRASSMVQGGSLPTNDRRRMGGELRRMAGRWLPAMVVAFGFMAFAPACLAALPVVSNPTPVSFGSQAVGSAQAQTTVTFTVTTGGTLDTTPLVLTTGAPNLDYTLGTGSTCTGSASAGTCTVNVVFTPKAPGQRLGAVVLTSGGATVATALLNGTGTGAAVVFPGNAAIVPLGSGFGSSFGVAVDGAGNVYVTDAGNGAVKEIVAVGGSIPSSPVIRMLGSGFSSPIGVAVDGAGNVYVANEGNNAVQEIVAVGGSIPASNPTILSLGSGFSGPFGVAVDGAGNVYVGDSGHNAVKEIVAVGGSIPASSPTIRTLGSGFGQTLGVAVDGAGNVYVGDAGNGVVSEIVAVGGSIPSGATIRQLGVFSDPSGVAVDGAGNVYVSNTDNNAVVQEIVAVGGSIPASNPTILTLGSSFNAPRGVAVDGAGNVYFANQGNGAVNEVPLATPPSLSFASTIVGSTSSDSPQTLLLQNIGNANLTFPIPSSGTNPSLSANYTLSTSSTCPQLTPSTFSEQTLAPGTCTAGISFTPATTGSIPGALVFTDNSLSAGNNAMQSVPLSGTGVLTPTITFTVPNHTFGDASFTVSATSNSTGAFTYSVVSGPATISGSTVTLTGAGTVVLQASEAASANFIASTKNASFPVAAGTPTITFVVPNHTFGDAPFTVSATSNSTGAFTYSVVSGPATISGSTVTLTGAGAVVLQASEAADANFIASTKNASFTVAAGTPLITFTVPNHTFGDAPFTVSATSNSTGAFTYSLVSGSATISGSTVTLTGAGTVVLKASEVADPNFLASTKNASFTVAAGTPTITFTVPNHTFGDAAFTVSATSNSTGAFTYSVVSGPATIFGSTVTLTGAGTVVLKASEVADPNFLASTKNASFTVAAGTPTITFRVPNHTFGDAAFTVSATSNSTGAFTYSVVSGPATISGSTVTLTGAGSVVLQASEVASANFIASTKNASFTVAIGTPSIVFTVPNHTFGDAPFAVSATSNSMGAFTYSVVSGPATISGSTVTLTGTGPVVLQASEAADANFAAGSKNASFTVAAAAPVITFTVPNHTFGDAAFTVSATSNSTGAFTYSVVSGPATISGATVTLTGAGTVVLQASEAASANFAAGSKNVSFTVAAATPVIVFTVPNHTFGDAPFNVSATSNSTGAFTYSVVSGPATITGSTVTLTGAGMVVLQASEAADANFITSTKNAGFTVAIGTPVIVFTVPNHTFGDAPFTVSATSNSTGVFTYSVVSGPATITGSTVTLTGAGTVVLQASEAADANFIASTKNASFTVAAGTSAPTITFTVTNHTFGDAPFTVSATSNSTGVFTYSVVSGPATITGSTVTLTGSGTVVFSAMQAASGNYTAATVTTSFTVAIAGFTLGPGSGSSSASTTPGGAASFSLVLNPGSGATILPDAISLSVSGLPPGATATFSPATIAAGSPATTVTLSIQTSSSQALLRNENPFSGKPIAPVTMGFLLLPLLGLKPVRKRFRKMSRFSVLAVTVVSLSVMLLGLGGCAGGSNAPSSQPATNYTVVVTATDATTSVQHTTNLTLTVQ